MSYPPPPALFVRCHLGLGDALILNALVRHLAQTQVVVFPAKQHNVPSVQFMFRDNPNIEVLPVKDDADADQQARRYSFSIKLGMFGPDFTFKRWDEQFYKQVGLPFGERWAGFHFRRSMSQELMPLPEPYIFLHDDYERKMVIRQPLVPSLPTVVPFPKRDVIFDYTAMIENAEEVHCIDSSFAILTDSIPTKAKRLVLHLYARKDAKPPVYRKNWEIIK